MPDGIASFSANGTTYIITANEGDDVMISWQQVKKKHNVLAAAAWFSAAAHFLMQQT